MAFATEREISGSAKRSSGVAKWRTPEALARWRGDFFGGTVAALIAAPYGMALAIAMGLRPEAGLYTSIIGVGAGALIALLLFVKRASQCDNVGADLCVCPGP